MKKIIIYIILTLSIMTGCSIDREPHGSMTSDDILSDPNVLIDALLNGTYAQVSRWCNDMHRLGEYSGDNMSIRGATSDAFYQFITYSRTTDNYRLDQFWNGSYKVIAQASNIIKMIEEEGAGTETDNRLGECYYLRGMMYFYLGRAFGRPYYDSPTTNLGVPIVNGTPDDMTNIVLPDRSTVEQTYAQAISDLKKSAEMMTMDQGPAFASEMSAYALLSRVYLYMSGTWANPNTDYAKESVKYADLVINSGDYSLLSRENFMKSNTVTPENNNESIFVSKNLATEAPNHWNSVGGMYSVVGGQGWGEMFASAKYLDLLSETGVNDFSTKTFTDARAAFIEPLYQEKEKMVFRYIANLYNKENEHTGYAYVQADSLNLKSTPIEMIETVVSKDEKDTTYVTYLLTPVPSRADEYTFTKGANTYTGAIDQFITTNNGHPQFYVVKCSKEGELSQLHSPVISRLGEVYLNKAEALAKQRMYGEALVLLNMIRERSIPGAAYPSLNATNAEELIDKERQLELAYQAERSYDVYRSGGTLTREYPGQHNAMLVVSPDDYRVAHLIPQNMINAYAPNILTQNPIQ